MPHVLHLPQVYGSGPVAQDETCAMNAQAVALFARMKAHPQQRRPSVVCHPILVAVAQAKSEDMGKRDYFSHTDPDGHGPNWRLRQAGYRLPDWYSKADNGNNTESIAAGQPTAAIAWQGWMQSVSHSGHVLGTIDSYADQIYVGMGYAFVEGTVYGHYWVCLSAPVQP